MKKGINLTVTMLLLAVMLTAQPLTFRGDREMPGEMVVATFDQFEPGDQIIGSYIYNGNLYASEIRIARDTKFQITAFRDDSDTLVKTGVYHDELPVYVLYRNNNTYALTINREKGKWYNTGELKLLNDTLIPVTVYDNLHYSRCPRWPAATEVDIAGKVRLAPYSEPFYKWFRTHVVRPVYYGDLSFELVTGDGELFASRTINYHRYRFMPSDFKRGYIEILFKATPLPNCPVDDIQTRLIRINLTDDSN